MKSKPGKRPKETRGSPPPTRQSPAASRRWPVLRFLTVFALLLGAFYALVLMPSVDRIFYEYLRVNAWLANAVLLAFGQHTTVSDVTIRSHEFAVSIRRGCDAVEPAWFFCAAVLAFPAPWRLKPAAIVIGAGVIFALNLVRIVSLFYIGRYLPASFGPAHLEIWPAVFIVLALVLWIVWIRSALPDRAAKPTHASA